MRIATKRPSTWAEGTEVTPTEWVDWFLRCTPEEQAYLGEQAVGAMHDAGHCLMADHRGAVEQVDYYRGQVIGLLNTVDDVHAMLVALHDRLQLIADFDGKMLEPVIEPIQRQIIDIDLRLKPPPAPKAALT